MHRVLKEKPICTHYGAKRLPFECDTFCCMDGKTKLADPYIPDELYNLFTTDTDLGKRFRLHIRAYNTNFSFASMGINLDKSLANSTGGVYTFRVIGTIYHRIDQLVPREGIPKYLQLYIYDPESELSHRLTWDNLDRDIVVFDTCPCF